MPEELVGAAKLESFLERNPTVPFLGPAHLEGAATAYAKRFGGENVSYHLLQGAVAARASEASKPGAPKNVPAAALDASQRQANVASALALCDELSLDGTVTPPSETAEWFVAFDEIMTPFKSACTPTEWQRALASNAILCMDGWVRQTMGLWMKGKQAHAVSWPEFKAHVSSKFAPQNWAMQAVISGVLKPCPHKHGGVVAQMCTEWLAELENMLTPEALRIVEQKNPAASCALVRTLLVPCFGKGAEKKLQDSRHLARRLERDAEAKTDGSGDSVANASRDGNRKEPCLEDVDGLAQWVQPEADQKGRCPEVKRVAAV